LGPSFSDESIVLLAVRTHSLDEPESTLYRKKQIRKKRNRVFSVFLFLKSPIWWWIKRRERLDQKKLGLDVQQTGTL
jgi:hypothetical protein